MGLKFLDSLKQAKDKTYVHEGACGVRANGTKTGQWTTNCSALHDTARQGERLCKLCLPRQTTDSALCRTSYQTTTSSRSYHWRWTPSRYAHKLSGCWKIHMDTYCTTHVHGYPAQPTSANRTVAAAVAAPGSALTQSSILTSTDRTNSTMANTHPSPKSRATASDSSITQKHTMIRSRLSTRTLSDCARQPPTGWLSTTLHTGTAIMLQLLRLYQERRI